MYSTEKSVQILIAVLKANGIKKVVVSPGTTNISFVVSMVNDGDFEMYSAVDERGAAYIACGLSSESGEPVVITCTGATASRNYFPGLTEAYHRKLPILAVTASQDYSRNGHLYPQFIDRSQQPLDSVKMSVHIPVIRSEEEEFDATVKINKAVLELFHRGGGPVHINLASSYCDDFFVKDLSHIRIIKRYTCDSQLPEMPAHKRIAIIVGNHKRFSEKLTSLIDTFCSFHNAVVIVDHSSHYWGKYRVLPTIITCQAHHHTDLLDIDLLIHLGEEHGDYYTDSAIRMVGEVWRVSEDGEIRDTFKKLTNVFEMTEESFFSYYSRESTDYTPDESYFEAIKNETKFIYKHIPELPFSNIWIAQQIIPIFPQEACLELGVSNTMRSWTFFDFTNETYTLANTGCRGIDGAIPTILGMSLANTDRIHFAVMGDLTFFYSFNVLGNRNVGNNIRILLINNGCGEEFNINTHRAFKIYSGNHERINEFIAAGGHNGSKSKVLVKHYAEDLGMLYYSASSKDEFRRYLSEFLDIQKHDQSIIFEVFTEVENENTALQLIRNAVVDSGSITVRDRISSKLPDNIKKTIKEILK